MGIEDLSKWDFAGEFFAYEAAALMAGIDPAEIYVGTEPAKDNSQIYDFHEHPQIKPVAERLIKDLGDAYDLYSAMRNGKWEHSTVEPPSEFVLRNREMEVVPLKIGSRCLPLEPTTQAALDTWANSEDGVYETAKFTRSELSRWLSANRLHSKYLFESPPVVGVPVSIDKSLGTTERKTLLTIIAALVKAAKINIDQPGKAAIYIEGLTAELGARVSKRAIENHLKRIPDALETRMK